MFERGKNGSLARFGGSFYLYCGLVGWDDFKIVREAGKQLGGNSIDFRAASEFNDCISKCGLMEFDVVGSKYNWQQSGKQMWQKVDSICVICNFK